MRDRLRELGLLAPPRDGPAVLIYDLENTPLLGWTWGWWKQNLLGVAQYSYLLCFSYGWYGGAGFTSRDIRWVGLPQDPEYRPAVLAGDLAARHDRWVAERLHALLDAADVAVTQNGDKFDAKKANTRFSLYGLGPVSPCRSVDTLKESRRYMDQPSHGLGPVSEFYGHGGKEPHQGFPLWLGCMDGDRAAWRTMQRYNRRDVLLTARRYEELLPWIGSPGHTQGVKYNLWDRDACPKCGAVGTMIRRGFHRTALTVFQTVQCSKPRGGCGGYSRLRQGEREGEGPRWM